MHASGGTPEIVGFDERLMYDSETDAAEKIGAVLSDSAAQAEIVARLDQHKALFHPDAYGSAIRRKVAGMIRP